ncbi:MAG: XRE family transcriptional regulator [Muribaculaceae bacterium]|nr:XRE family transcriptional regulator [Muribaculaceae bacterium]
MRIKTVFDRQPKHVTVVWFARQLNCRRNNVYDIFRRPTIDTELLARISKILNHNFFKEIADDIETVNDGSAGK